FSTRLGGAAAVAAANSPAATSVVALLQKRMFRMSVSSRYGSGQVTRRRLGVSALSLQCASSPPRSAWQRGAMTIATPSRQCVPNAGPEGLLAWRVEDGGPRRVRERRA